MLGDQLELLDVGGQRVQHQVLHSGVDPGLDLGLDLVDGARHVHLVDVLPRPLVADDVAEPRLLHRTHFVGSAALLDPREVLVGDGERDPTAGLGPRR